MSLAKKPDPLSLRRLRRPILNEFMGSQMLKAELMAIANEIKSRYTAKVPKDSGKLASSVRIRPFRSKDSVDRRWNVDVTIGGTMGVDYADDVEARYGILASVLREMGYNTGDYVRGPTGRQAKEAPPKAARASKGREERMAELRSNPDPEVQKYIERVERFRAVRFNSRSNLDSDSAYFDYQKLRKSTLAVQAMLGNEAAEEGYSALRDFRGARILSGFKGSPLEGGRLNQEMINERIGERGGVTWEMRQRGIESPYDRGEDDPLTNYFSAEELRYYGWKPNGD